MRRRVADAGAGFLPDQYQHYSNTAPPGGHGHPRHMRTRFPRTVPNLPPPVDSGAIAASAAGARISRTGRACPCLPCRHPPSSAVRRSDRPPRPPPRPPRMRRPATSVRCRNGSAAAPARCRVLSGSMPAGPNARPRRRRGRLSPAPSSRDARPAQVDTRYLGSQQLTDVLAVRTLLNSDGFEPQPLDLLYSHSRRPDRSSRAGDGTRSHATSGTTGGSTIRAPQGRGRIVPRPRWTAVLPARKRAWRPSPRTSHRASESLAVISGLNGRTAERQNGRTAERQNGRTAARQHGSLSFSLSHFPPRIDSRRAYPPSDTQSRLSLEEKQGGLRPVRRHEPVGAQILRSLDIGRHVLW